MSFVILNGEGGQGDRVREESTDVSRSPEWVDALTVVSEGYPVLE